MSQSSLFLIVCLGCCVPFTVVAYHVVLGLRLKRQVDTNYEALQAIARDQYRQIEPLLNSLRRAQAST